MLAWIFGSIIRIERRRRAHRAKEHPARDRLAARAIDVRVDDLRLRERGLCVRERHELVHADLERRRPAHLAEERRQLRLVREHGARAHHHDAVPVARSAGGDRHAAAVRRRRAEPDMKAIDGDRHAPERDVEERRDRRDRDARHVARLEEARP